MTLKKKGRYHLQCSSNSSGFSKSFRRNLIDCSSWAGAYSRACWGPIVPWRYVRPERWRSVCWWRARKRSYPDLEKQVDADDRMIKKKDLQLGCHCQNWSACRSLGLGAQDIHCYFLWVENYNPLGEYGKINNIAMFLSHSQSFIGIENKELV